MEKLNLIICFTERIPTLQLSFVNYFFFISDGVFIDRTYCGEDHYKTDP
jgi:hypothetical protein